MIAFQFFVLLFIDFRGMYSLWDLSLLKEIHCHMVVALAMYQHVEERERRQ